MTQTKRKEQGQIEPVVVDPHQRSILYVDWIAAAGFGPASGTINLDLAAIDPSCSDKKQPHAVVQCKIRMTSATAQNIIRSLSTAIAASQAPLSSQDEGSFN